MGGFSAADMDFAAETHAFLGSNCVCQAAFNVRSLMKDRLLIAALKCCVLDDVIRYASYLQQLEDQILSSIQKNSTPEHRESFRNPSLEAKFQNAVPTVG